MLKLCLLFCVFPTIYGVKAKNFTSVDELIIGGQPIEIEDVPYQAALYYRNYYFCAGCIVSHTHIVTAAHCLIYLPKNLNGLSIRVGTSKMHGGGQIVQAKKISLHPKFSIRTIDYDVGVIELKTPLKFSRSIQPIKLGDKEPREGQEVRVSGWGFVKEIGPPSRKLQSVLVTIVNRKICAKNYKNRITVTNRMICASAEDKDACYGDSGGPLVQRGKLIGIVSTGEGCARKNFPGIYTSTTHSEVKEFILKETGIGLNITHNYIF